MSYLLKDFDKYTYFIDDTPIFNTDECLKLKH